MPGDARKRIAGTDLVAVRAAGRCPFLLSGNEQALANFQAPRIDARVKTLQAFQRHVSPSCEFTQRVATLYLHPVATDLAGAGRSRSLG